MDRNRESEGRYARLETLATDLLIAASRQDIDEALEVGEEIILLMSLLHLSKRANDELGGK